MTYHVITATQGGFISGNGDTIFEAQGVAITGGIDMRYKSDDATYGGGGDQTVYIYGGLFGDLDDYYQATSGDDQITIGQTGYVTGEIQLGGGGHTITNLGSVAADRFGEAVYVLGGVGAHQDDADTLVNAGTISASALAGVNYYDVITFLGVSSVKLVNSGSILASTGQTAISALTNGSSGSTISNTGLISGDIAFDGALKLTNYGTIDGNIGQYGAATVVNRGAITGNMTFSDGASHTFDGRRGTVDGTITGGYGIDTIRAGDDGETIAGGGGRDLLSAGAGRDTFAFSSYSSADYDYIASFDVTKDTIQLDHMKFTHLAAGTQPTFSIATAPTSATDYLFYNSSSGKLSYDPDASASHYGAYTVAILDPGLKLTAADFRVV